jgi:hypothetical protein
MKKASLLTVTLSILFLFAICGHGRCQDTSRVRSGKVQDITSPYIILLDSATATRYIDIYQRKFTRWHNMNHTKYIFLDTTYFSYLYTFFTDPANSQYDGIRIYFADYNDFIDPDRTHQARKKQITILLAPTIHQEGQLNVFLPLTRDALNHGELCPNACDPQTPNSMRTVQRKIVADPSDKFIFIDSATASGYMKNYKRKYDFLWNKKHSRSLWMGKDDFIFLGKFFQADAVKQPYAGIRISFAAYGAIIPEMNNVRKKQITLVFSAAKSNEAHEADYNALRNYYYRSFDPSRTPVNHAKLCPGACDPISQ